MNALLCPDCVVEMQTHRLYGVAVDICPACAGIWFDDRELRALKEVDPLILLSLEERAIPDVVWDPKETISRRCPRCSIALTPYRYQYRSSVELDGCAQCHGIWVQNGELKKIHEQLQVQEAPPEAEEKRRLAIAQYAMESQEQVERANLLTSLFSLLRKRVPPFAGFG